MSSFNPRFDPARPPRPLRDARHEKYAKARVAGMTPAQARTHAGYGLGFPSAQDLEFEPEIVDRIAELNARNT